MARPRDAPDAWDGLTQLQPVWLPHPGNHGGGIYRVLDVLGYLDEIPLCVGYED